MLSFFLMIKNISESRKVGNFPGKQTIEIRISLLWPIGEAIVHRTKQNAQRKIEFRFNLEAPNTFMGKTMERIKLKSPWKLRMDLPSQMHEAMQQVLATLNGTKLPWKT